MLYEMTFYNDFRKILKELQFIPEVSVGKTVDLEMKVKALSAEPLAMENASLKEKLAALEQKLKALEEKQ